MPFSFAEGAQENNKLSPIVSTALLEGIIVASAAMAAYDPEVYGWALTVVSPFVFGNEASTIENTAGFAALAGFGQYNVHELSKKNINLGNVHPVSFEAA